MSLHELPDDELMDFLRRRLPIDDLTTIDGKPSKRPLIEHLAEAFNNGGRAALEPYIRVAEVPRVLGLGATESQGFKDGGGAAFDVPTEDDLSFDLDEALVCCRKLGADRLVAALKRAIMYEKVLIDAGVLREENGRLVLVARKTNVHKTRQKRSADDTAGPMGLESLAGSVVVSADRGHEDANSSAT